jgi:monofunctional biosynthetic peptidoglycan transglycosylase
VSAGRVLGYAFAGFLAATLLPVLVLRFVPVPISAFMLEKRIADWQDRAAHPEFSYHWVPWDRISAPAKLAPIAAEDQRFAEHDGFDFEAIDRALKHNRHGHEVHGASTISQQVAKNLFLWPQRSWTRKALEAWFTVLIEMTWPKRRILEVYLNVAELGDNTYGAEAAARRFWNKHAIDLDTGEAARLAAVLPAPQRLHAQAPSRYVETRAAWIRGQMRQLGPDYVDGL